MEIVDSTPRPPCGFPQLILWSCPVVEIADVSHRVLKELSVYGGDQKQVVVLAYINKSVRPPNVTVATVVHYVLGDWRAVNFSCDDDFDSIYFIKLLLAADVEKFHGHSWWWFQERVTFRRILRPDETPELTARATATAKAP